MDEPVRVLHLFMGMDRSGVPVMLMNYYRHIDRKKVQFDFAVEVGEEKYFDREIGALGGRVYRLGMKSTRAAYYTRLSKVIRENKYDTVHAHYNYRNLPLLFFALLHGVKNRVSHSHNSYTFKGLLQKSYRKTAVFLLNIISTELLACSSPAGRSLYGKRRLDSGQVKVVNNAIEPDRFNYDKSARGGIRRSLGLEGKKVIGHVGNFIPQKNHGFLIDIFGEIHKKEPEARLVLIGGGRLMKQARDKVLDSGLEDHVLFLGSRDDVNALYNAFDVLAFPSLFEGLAIVLLEAQAAGLRCLVSDSTPQEADVTGLLEFMPLEKGAYAWADRVLEMVSEDYDRRGRGDEFVRKGFDISREAVVLEDMYLEMKGRDGKR